MARGRSLKHKSRARRAMDDAARELARRLDELGRVSDEPRRLTRTFLSPAMSRANRLVGSWMSRAGLAAAEDGFGNLTGTRGAGPTLVMGSHLDTVRDAGRFDGALGVLLPLAALRVLDAEKVGLPFAVRIVGFSEEEGVRFGAGYIGSRGFIGRLTRDELARRDAKGITVEQALAMHRARIGPSAAEAPEGGRSASRRRPRILGYIEAHIEQGPVLEKEGVPVGVVTAIAGQTRGRLRFTGEAGHAGTVPMALRRDALAGAAEWMAWAEAWARRHVPLVATVGMIQVSPGASNVIPAVADLSMDVRHPRDSSRRAALRALLGEALRIAARRRLRVAWTVLQDHGAVACDARLSGVLASAAGSVQGHAPRLVSGAGHDAVPLSRAMPVSMLFVRCRGGISHHPSEFVAPRDLRAALEVLCEALRRLAGRPGSPA